jgi:toxin ParE1/3/4
MRIRWLRNALKNLEDEAGYIARDDPQAARNVVQRIHRVVALLVDNPSLGHPGRVTGTRELVVPGTSYIIPYRVSPKLRQIEILRVFHAARKPPERW